jgi:hypothetical protein
MTRINGVKFDPAESCSATQIATTNSDLSAESLHRAHSFQSAYPYYPNGFKGLGTQTMISIAEEGKISPEGKAVSLGLANE